MTDETKAEMVRRARAFAKYHEEHAAYGGAGREFHERAASFLRADVPGIVSALDIAQARAAYWQACATRHYQSKHASAAEQVRFEKEQWDALAKLRELGAEP